MNRTPQSAKRNLTPMFDTVADSPVRRRRPGRRLEGLSDGDSSEENPPITISAPKEKKRKAEKNLMNVFEQFKVQPNWPKKKKTVKSTTASVPKVVAPVSSKSDSVSFSSLVKLFEMVGATTKKLEKRDLVMDYLFSLYENNRNDILHVVYLFANNVFPAFLNRELGVADASLVEAISKKTGRKKDDIRKAAADAGDLSAVVKKQGRVQPTLFQEPPLTVRMVIETLREIESAKGKDSQKRKQGCITKLLTAAKGNEPIFIIRCVQQRLRIGFAEQLLLESLGGLLWKITDGGEGTLESNNENIQRVKRAYAEYPSFERLVEAMLSDDAVEQLEKQCILTPGVPVKPMLARPTKGTEEIFKRLGDSNFTCEYKYDGERAQIHKNSQGVISIFSRNMECHTEKYPDLISDSSKWLRDTNNASFVLDCEVVAYDRVNQKLKPFQILATRGRKDVKEKDVIVQVCLFAFDLLYFDGESFLNRCYADRRRELRERFQRVEGKFHFAEGRDFTEGDTDALTEFFDESLKNSCEGLMIKTLNNDENQQATYEPSKRSLKWLKLKKDYIESLSDTLDLVPIAAWKGKGKRSQWLGSFLMACYDEESAKYQTICKVGTGMSEEQLAQFHKYYVLDVEEDEKKPEGERQGYISRIAEFTSASNSRFKKEDEAPSIWIRPDLVWEIRAGDLTLSPEHTAAFGMADAGKGIALRFPRFIRIRDDKNPEDASNSEQVLQMYQQQDQIKNAAVEEDSDLDI